MGKTQNGNQIAKASNGIVTKSYIAVKRRGTIIEKFFTFNFIFFVKLLLY